MSEKGDYSAGQADYRSFLLRLWRAKAGEPGWRASLESGQTGERKGFATLDALFDHLRWLARAEPEQASGGEARVQEDGQERG